MRPISRETPRKSRRFLTASLVTTCGKSSGECDGRHAPISARKIGAFRAICPACAAGISGPSFGHGRAETANFADVEGLPTKRAGARAEAENPEDAQTGGCPPHSAAHRVSPRPPENPGLRYRGPLPEPPHLRE